MNYVQTVGFGGIDPLHFLAGCHKRRLSENFTAFPRSTELFVRVGDCFFSKRYLRTEKV